MARLRRAKVVRPHSTGTDHAKSPLVAGGSATQLSQSPAPGVPVTSDDKRYQAGARLSGQY
jgi:hypothetical protein